MVRKGKWKLVHFVDNEQGQLFDLSVDPDERVNLWDHADHRDTQVELVTDILNWRIESSRKTQGFQQMLSQSTRHGM